MSKKTICVSIFMHIISIILALINLFLPTWFNLANKNFGLVFCSSCSYLHKDWTWECFARVYCENSSSDCDMYTEGYESSTLFIILETIFIIFTLLILNRLILNLLGRGFGSFATLMFFEFFTVSFKISAFFVWVFRFWYKYRDEVSLRNGAVLSVCCVVWEIFTTFVTVFSIWRLCDNNDSGVLRSYRCGINRKVFMIISSLLLTIGAFLSITSLDKVYWVSGGDAGTLMRCKNCELASWIPWHCLSSSACETNPSSSSCKNYSNYSSAGNIYLTFSLISSISVLQIQDYSISYIFFNIFGLYSLTSVIFTQLYLFFAVFFQGLGIFYWIGKTEASIKSSCLDSDCTGPLLGILSFIFITLGSVFFILSKPQLTKFLNTNLKGTEPQELHPDSPASLSTKSLKCIARPNSFAELPAVENKSLLDFKLPRLAPNRPIRPIVKFTHMKFKNLMDEND